MYLAITVEIKEDNYNGLYAFAYPVSENSNIKSVLDSYKNIVHANVFQTRKKAREVVEDWNTAYKNNGTYAFNKAF